MTHDRISFIKSGIRIIGFVLLGYGLLVPAAFALVFAELLGVAEELV